MGEDQFRVNTLPRRRSSLRSRLSGSLRSKFFPKWRRHSTGEETKALQWIHDDGALQQNAVKYNVKYLGYRETQHAKGSDIIIQTLNEIKCNSKRRSSADQNWMTLFVSQETVHLLDESTPDEPVVVFEFASHRISSVSEYTQGDIYLGMNIRHGRHGQHRIHAFETDHESQSVALTLAQAFHLAFTNYIRRQSSDEETSPFSSPDAGSPTGDVPAGRATAMSESRETDHTDHYLPKPATPERSRLSMKWLTEAQDCSLAQSGQQLIPIGSGAGLAYEQSPRADAASPSSESSARHDEERIQALRELDDATTYGQTSPDELLTPERTASADGRKFSEQGQLNYGFIREQVETEQVSAVSVEAPCAGESAECEVSGQVDCKSQESGVCDVQNLHDSVSLHQDSHGHEMSRHNDDDDDDDGVMHTENMAADDVMQSDGVANYHIAQMDEVASVVSDVIEAIDSTGIEDVDVALLANDQVCRGGSGREGGSSESGACDGTVDNAAGMVQSCEADNDDDDDDDDDDVPADECGIADNSNCTSQDMRHSEEDVCTSGTAEEPGDFPASTPQPLENADRMSNALDNECLQGASHNNGHPEETVSEDATATTAGASDLPQVQGDQDTTDQAGGGGPNTGHQPGQVEDSGLTEDAVDDQEAVALVLPEQSAGGAANPRGGESNSQSSGSETGLLTHDDHHEAGEVNNCTESLSERAQPDINDPWEDTSDEAMLLNDP